MLRDSNRIQITSLTASGRKSDLSADSAKKKSTVELPVGAYGRWSLTRA